MILMLCKEDWSMG